MILKLGIVIFDDNSLYGIQPAGSSFGMDHGLSKPAAAAHSADCEI